ncbi:sensor histidine kinase [Sphaerisporangium siamense]|uniref:histidine kinase n=1 Tax=Sphaerisporangium siamense TaxID=795645 RepID=A0A7W7GBS7_9ACTN|nr:sensor histidine kinase [Sphaerisporangium siamense]MBB4703807.1 two-component system sensor histidine kinase UhpB [Sphaerisporangium siamense]GII82276.1 sensor histidine kinase [Sphaerisporangium siamense]
MTAAASRHAGPGRDARGRARPMASALLGRIMLINGLVFAAGLTVLALSPATISSPVLLTEVPVLAAGLALMLGANALLLRRGLAPLAALTALMERVDLLRPSARCPGGGGELGALVGTFNAMLDRLEAERSASSAHALAAQEAERQRIARELHDEIGQSLTVVLLGLKRGVDRAPEDLREDLRTVQETVRASLDEVRRIARRLRPGVLDDLGLPAAMNALMSEFSEVSGVPVTRLLDPRLPGMGGEAELVIYRIAQEGLTNVARHAGASHVEVSLRAEQEGAVVLRIADDGRGGPIREGTGIRGMRERALLIGAGLSIGERPRGGTEVRLTVPAPPGGGPPHAVPPPVQEAT